jgi:Domain of unknown function (DUF4340)
MRARNAGMLLAAAVAVAALATVAVMRRESATTAVNVSQIVLPQLASRINETTAMEITGPKGAFRVARDAEGRWIMPEKSGYPANADKIRKAILGLAELAAVESRTDNPAQYERLGVGDPGAASSSIGVRLLDGSGRDLANLIVGKTKTPESEQRPAEIYVRRPGEAGSWLAKGRLGVVAESVEWLDREVFRLRRERVAEVLVTHADGEKVRVFRDKPDAADFTLAGIPKGKVATSAYDVNALPGALEFVTFEDVRRASDLNIGAGTVSARFKTFDGLVVTVRTAARDSKFWARYEISAEAAAPPAGGASLLDAEAVKKQAAEWQARVADWVYQIGDYQAKDLTRRLADLVREEEKAPAEKKNGT